MVVADDTAVTHIRTILDSTLQHAQGTSELKAMKFDLNQLYLFELRIVLCDQDCAFAGSN
jgi:hypothetical protein